MNFTQNIDDLEIDAGIKEEKLFQAHGHSRSAHCIKCKK
jgi:NAD-dependent SIR2 family protein deacetylase